ncbi:unnamed protein product [Caenorhabditis brenneri]
MASILKAAHQSLDVARPTRASQAKFRQSTICGSVQNEQSVQSKLVHPRWNTNTRISSATKTADQKTETADQKIKRFRKREEVLRDRLCVSNHSMNPTRRSFSDLPAEILNQILEYLDPISRLVTRNVSKTLRSIVDFQKPNVNQIEFLETPKRIEIQLQQPKQYVSFFQNKNWCSARWRGKKTIVGGVDYVNLTLQFLKPISSSIVV